MKKLFEIEKLIIELDYYLDKLPKYGFKKVWRAGSSSRFIYINKRRGIVVKKPYIDQMSVYREQDIAIIPTIMIDLREVLDQKDGLYNYIVIQPIADVRAKSQRKAYDILLDKIKTKGLDCPYDLRRFNTGFYRNQAVMIDW